ncbi:MAG: DNA alkylation repair protein [Muribaculaceae bacterium]|nr:DNA alkylation repair protein [Muribaculaceae bacterium]
MEKEKVTAAEVSGLLEEMRDEAQRAVLMRFFKTGAGQYGEGDQFLGLKVPQTRAIVREAKLLVPLDEIAVLVSSPWHEVRLAGFLLLVEEMKAALPKRKDSAEAADAKATRRKEIADFYLKWARQANNWDLVDLSCEYVLGPHLLLDCADCMPTLLALARSENLWEQRIAIVSTFHFIRNGIFGPTFAIVDLLMGHGHDLIHKAMGWMLREVGKRDKAFLVDYLERNADRLPRTTLRYAIEKFPEPERKAWLARR